MLPLTLSAPAKLANILSASSALDNAVAELAANNNVAVPTIGLSNILLSSVPSEMSDLAEQYTYPRIVIYCSSLQNAQIEKFRSLSGSLSVVAEIWSSGNFVSDPDSWIHYYVEAFTSVIQANIGDWGDGICYLGSFDVQIQPPKRGGFGFLQGASIHCHVLVGRN